MRRLPSLTALRAFEAAARLSSVTAAAAELGISHSAISQHIRQLEEYFGQRLFNRRGRRIEPAPAALAYLEDVRAAFDRLALASDQLARRGSQRALSINATPSFAMRWLIPHTAAFQLDHPSIELRISTSDSDSIAQLKENPDLIVRREPMTRTDYVCRRLLDDVSTPVAAPSLLKRHVLEKPADLLRLPLLHMRSRPDAWAKWFKMQGVRWPATLSGPYLDHFFLSLQAASSGLGVAIGPHVLMEEDLRSKRLVAPFCEHPLVGPGFHVLYRTQLVADRAGRTVLEWLQKITGAELL
ncbi:MAG TPA: LysR substrate-binding domain-containing protein [Steroidobacteraceae bacterium]|nr:LysR substrate-binding domain-containing protein [Steroidobacteraceae bacterium]